MVEGKWTARTAGGNHALPTFMNNPMWRVLIDKESNRANAAKAIFKATLMAIDLAGNLETVKAMNLKLVRADGEGRVYELSRTFSIAEVFTKLFSNVC